MGKKNTNKTIIVFSPYFYPFMGGLARNVRTLGKLLIQKYGYSYTVITIDTERTGKPNETIDGINLVRIRCYNAAKLLGEEYFVPDPIELYKVIKSIEWAKVDVISTQTRFFILSLVGVIIGKIKHIPVVHTDRGSTFVKQGNIIVRTIAYLVDQTVGRFVLKNASQVVGVSNATCEFDKRLGAKDPVTIYNGIYPEFWQKKTDKQQTRQKFKLNKDDFVITFYGRMIRAKGVFDLLRAFEEIGNNKFKLILIGDGVNLGDVQSYAQKSPLSESIIITGGLEHEQIREILHITDVFINPSYTEGIPTSVTESVASRTYVLASDVGGTREILCSEELGQIFEPGNIEQIKLLLKDAFANKEKIHSIEGKPLPECYTSRFDWDRIAQQYHEVFENATKR